MRLSELGGELAFLQRIARPARGDDVVVGIGDDCAVVRISPDRLLLYTTDMLVEGNHFSLEYFGGEDLGIKAMECNVADVAAMGGRPRFALLSFCARRDTPAELVESLYRGLYSVCDRYGFDLIGGDITAGEALVMSITLVGETTPERLRLRSMARPGELIVVSGGLGGSAAGLRLLQCGVPGHQEVKARHLRPRCALDRLESLLPLSRAMEDISDGLASEVRNICQASGVGARLHSAAIPLAPGVAEAAALLGESALEWALFGGEDYELVYTMEARHREQAVGAVVGEVVAEPGVQLDGRPLTRFGWDHLG